MIDISKKLTKDEGFPIHVFGQNVADSMRFVSSQYNIPIDYMGAIGLFTLAGLSGSMYVGNANGGIKTMLYMMIVGPSGVGKTPAYRVMCSNIIKEQFKVAFERYREDLVAWKNAERIASKAGTPFEMRKPTLAVRMMTDGTPEGMIKKMDKSPCGFGVYYDEAEKIYNLTKYRKGSGGSTDFWNEIWNGDPYYDVKADEEREMYVQNPSASLCVGVQPDVLDKIITPESIRKGLSSRMLFCESDYITLNETIDPFGPKAVMCNEWTEIISSLHNKGLNNFFKDDVPYVANFTSDAMRMFTDKVNELLRLANVDILKVKKSDFTEIIVSYNSKMNQYFPRFCLLMAIFKDHMNPVITPECIENATEIYDYFLRNGYSILNKVFDQHQADLNATELKLLNALPDAFTSELASLTCAAIGLNEKYFLVAMGRGLAKKIRKVARGNYEKL